MTQPSATVPEKASVEEVDNLHRSTKKYKSRDSEFSQDQSRVQRQEDWMDGKRSFKEILMRHNGEWDSEEEEEGAAGMEVEDTGDSSQGLATGSDEVLLETREDGRTNFKRSDEFKRKAWKPWKKTLLVKLLGKKLSVSFMKNRLEKRWAREGKVLITDLENDYYMVRFEKQKDMDFAQLAGPWVIFYHYLAIRAWKPDFEPSQSSIGRITTWARLPGFPMEYVNTSLIKNVGDWLGKFVKLDAATTSLARGKYARISVELDLNQPLKAEYYIDGRYKQVVYEGLHMICYGCGKYGHSVEACPDGVKSVSTNEVNRVSDMEGEQGNGLVAEELMLPAGDREETETKAASYGPWMVVSKNRKGRNQQGKASPEDNGMTEGKRMQEGQATKLNTYGTGKKEGISEVSSSNLSQQSGLVGQGGVKVHGASKRKANKVPITVVETDRDYRLLGGDELKQGSENRERGLGNKPNLSVQHKVDIPLHTPETVQHGNGMEVMSIEGDSTEKVVQGHALVQEKTEGQLQMGVSGLQKPEPPDPISATRMDEMPREGIEDGCANQGMGGLVVQVCGHSDNLE